MKKILLLCMAFSGLFALNAQNLPQQQSLAKLSSSPTSKVCGGDNLEKLQVQQKFSKDKASRSLEDHVMDPKVMGNINATVPIYMASLSCNKAISMATYYEKDLVERFKGNKITAFYTVISTGATSATFWIRKELNGKNVWEGEAPAGFPTAQEIGIECDYTIDEGPLYVGCTLSIPSLVGTSKSYVYFAPDIQKSRSMLIDNNSGAGWGDYSSNGALYLVCQTEGENGLKDNDVQLSNLDIVNRVQTGDEYYLTGSFTNYGAYPVLSFKTKHTLDGVETEYEIPTDTLDFMQTTYFQMPCKAPEKGGRYQAGFEITEVNGTADGTPSDNTSTTTLVAIDQPYKRKVVMEEFTGTGCGYCPRGIVGMEKLAKDYPDDFIGIGVHTNNNGNDPFTETTYTPLSSLISSNPMAFLNRIYFADPYYGFGETPYGIKDAIEESLKRPSEALIGIDSKLSADSKNIEVTSYLKFGYSTEKNTYAMAYVLLEDSLEAYQTNYYSNMYSSQTGFTYLNLPDDLKFLFREGSPYLTSVNHVARGIYDCFGIEGSLVGNISSKDVKTHTYTIPVPSTISDMENLSIVAMLIDTENSEIVSAEKAKIGKAALTGIGTVNRNGAGAEISVSDGAVNISAQNATACIYSMNGQLVSSVKVNGQATLPTVGMKGVYIVKVDNGNDVVVKKVQL